METYASDRDAFRDRDRIDLETESDHMGELSDMRSDISERCEDELLRMDREILAELNEAVSKKEHFRKRYASYHMRDDLTYMNHAQGQIASLIAKSDRIREQIEKEDK